MKMSRRLCSVKSNIISKEEIKEHSRKTDQFKNMILRKSPKNKAYLKNLAKKKNYEMMLPGIYENNGKYF